MWRCPVCGKENKQLLCGSCGFDSSCDYERYPTLGNLNGSVDSVSRRKAARQAADTKMLGCPNCGGKQFSVDFEKQTYRCGGCGHLISVNTAPAKKQRLPRNRGKNHYAHKYFQGSAVAEDIKAGFGYGYSARPASDPKVEKKPLSGLKPRFSQGKDSTRKKKESRHDRIERLVLWLGWAMMLFWLYCLWNCVSRGDAPTGFVIMLFITGLMQWRLWKRGFDDLFQNKVLAFLMNIVYILMICVGAVGGVLSILLLVGGLVGGPMVEIALGGIIMCIPSMYYGLWALGQKDS